MRHTLVLACFALLAIFDHASAQEAERQKLRMKLHSSWGDFVKLKAPCGKDVRLKAIELLGRAPYVAIDQERMLAAVGDAQIYAERVVTGDVFVGFFPRGDNMTVAITVLRKLIYKGKVRVDFSVILREGNNACAEKWEGLAEVL